MSHDVRLNTLSYASKLEDAGIPHDQAKIQTQMVSDVFEELSTIQKDVAGLRTEMDTRFVAVDLKFSAIEVKFAELKSDIDVKFAKVDTKFSEVDAKFSELKFEIIKWVLGISIGQGALIVSILKILH